MTQSAARFLPWITAVLLLVILAVFIAATPSGVLAKADMIGYAVCHQITSHSFTFGGRPLPLCARCTGTFLGALTGLLGQTVILRRERAADFPPYAVLALLISFSAVWAADGLNSYLALMGAPYAYEPMNTIRLLTGALNGLTMSALIVPVVNVSLWKRPADAPNIRGPRDLIVLLLMQAGLIGLVLSGWDILLYPLALLSAVAVLALLTSVNTVLAVILTGRENRVDTWQGALVPFAVGFLLSIIEIGLIDLLRFQLTGTLGGLPLP